jgi:hypothetical protein
MFSLCCAKLKSIEILTRDTRTQVPVIIKTQKALGVFAALSQKLVNLFLFAENGVVYLESAALQLKTKMRRLYDIANILSSLHLIEKTYEVERIRKPAFKWIYNEDEHLQNSFLMKSNMIRSDPRVITQRKRGGELHVNTIVDHTAKNEGAKKRKMVRRSDEGSAEDSPLDQLASVAHEMFISMHEKPAIATSQSKDATNSTNCPGSSMMETYLTTRIASLQSLLSQISRQSFDDQKHVSQRQLDERLAATMSAPESQSRAQEELPRIELPLLCAPSPCS